MSKPNKPSKPPQRKTKTPTAKPDVAPNVKWVLERQKRRAEVDAIPTTLGALDSGYARAVAIIGEEAAKKLNAAGIQLNAPQTARRDREIAALHRFYHTLIDGIRQAHEIELRVSADWAAKDRDFKAELEAALAVGGVKQTRDGK